MKSRKVGGWVVGLLMGLIIGGIIGGRLMELRGDRLWGNSVMEEGYKEYNRGYMMGCE